MTQTELDCDVKGNAIDEEQNVGAVDTDSFLPVPETELKGVKDLPSTVPDDEEAVDYKKLDLCHRLRVDHLFRRRFIHSFWLFWSCFGLGWMVGLYGPSFADLRQIVNQDLEAGSWLFTTAGIGYLVGSLLGGILFDRFNKLLIIGVSCVTMAVFTGFQPWCRSYPLMLALRFLSGLGGGGLDTGANADMVSIWDEEGRPYMQAMHASFGAGGIVAPLVIEPFLSEKILENVTNGNTSELVTVYGETNIHSAFLISLAVILTGALPFFYMYFRICCCGISHKMAAKKIDHKRPAKLPVGLKIALCILLCACMMSYCAVEDTFAGFLATFCVDYLQWDKSTSSYATSLYWGAFTVGRFTGIILIRFLRPVQLLCGYLICLILAFIGLFIASITMTEPAVWVFIPAPGFFMSVIFPCIFTWTEESILEVTGKISSMFLISASTGTLLNPLFVGYLMKNIAPISFLYVLLVESFLCFSLFIVIYCLLKVYIKTGSRSQTFEIVIPPPEEMTTLRVQENS
ncbi:sodium-dependent glucose transporter 1A-like [Mya arenaria]|uniref:sodium-dependent glucose transporter 1A-like n=1 Tax=Mya arenaria TaxID=6604 RepID=UPI0022E36A70|nr:sodium-dependent glucose transporter 1A-like [Mya arenaria]